MLSDVKGQDEGVRYLRRFVENSLTSPLLLVGDDGVGRRFSVMQAIRELFCSGTKQSGCQCVDCLYLDQGNHPDLSFITAPEEKDIGVDPIREIVSYSDNFPSMAPLRCFVIDGADRLTTAAANALLKTLEEPPSSARFFLIAEAVQQVLPTIRSRCGVVAYRPMPEHFIQEVIQRYESDATKALVYARMGEGSVGRSLRYWGAGRLGLRDQALALLQQALKGDLPGTFLAADAVAKEVPLALRFLEQLTLDVLMVTHDPTRLINKDRTEDIVKLRSSATPEKWAKLSSGMKLLRSRADMTRINLLFHTKALLADTFLV